MVNEAETVVNEAETAEQVRAEEKTEGVGEPEVQQPVGPTVAELQAKITALEAKYNKEVGAKDRGNARLANEVKQLKDGLVALARQQFNEVELPEEPTEFQAWLKKHLPPPESTSPPQLTPAEQDWLKEMNTELQGVGLSVANFATAMPDVATQADAAWERGAYGEAYRLIRNAVANKQQAAKPPAKTVVKIPVDREAPQGGGGSRKSVTREEIKDMPIEEYFQRHAEMLKAEQEDRIK